MATKVFVKTYGDVKLSGIDFGLVEKFDHRLTFSPDNKHSVSITHTGDGAFLILNNANVKYQLSVTRANNPMATVEYEPTFLVVNKQWCIGIDKRLLNRPFEPVIKHSKTLNFEIGATGTGRLDIKFDRMEYAAMLFNHKKLYSIRFNGDFAVSRFEAYIARECIRRPLSYMRMKKFLDDHPDVKMELIRRFVIDWVRFNQNANDDANSLMQKFITQMGLNRAIQ